jgi:molybdopterin converting factor small subunit
MATVIIPTPLRKFTDDHASVNLEATDVSELVQQLTSKYPGLKTPLFEVNGSLRPFINIFVNDDDIRNLQLEKTAVTDQSLVSIVPAIAGG